MSRTEPKTLNPSSASPWKLRRVVATVAAAATLAGAGGLVAAVPAHAAADTLTVTAPMSKSASNGAGAFTLTATSTAATVTYTAQSTLQLVGDGTNTTGESSAAFTNQGTTGSTTITTTAATASLLDPGKYDVDAAGAFGTSQTAMCSACFTVVGNAATFTSFVITANTTSTSDQIGQGATVGRAFTLTGTNFTKGTTLAVPAGYGLALPTVTVVSPTQITGTITASAAATGISTGKTNLILSQPSTGLTGTSALNVPITVTPAPVLTAGASTDPAPLNNAARIPAAETKTVTFTGTGLQSGVALKGTGATFGAPSGTTGTSTTSAITAGTTVGEIAVTATNPDGGTFATATTTTASVLAVVAARPTVTSTSPTLLAATTAQTLTINGTNFISGDGITFPNAGGDITVDATPATTYTATKITVNVDVVAKPTKSNYQVAITHKDPNNTTTGAAPDAATGVCASGCVSVAAFALTGVSPNSYINSGTPTVTISGGAFNATTVYTLNLTPSGGATPAQPVITATATYVAAAGGTPASLTATPNLDAAQAEAYTVSVSTNDTPSQSATCPASTTACAFNVLDNAPSVTSTSPTTLVPGQAAAVTITGTNFTHGSTLTTPAGDVTISNVVIVSSTKITATITAATSAVTTGTAASHALTLSTADSPAMTAAAGTIKVVAGPTLALVTPTSVTAGGTTTGAGTLTVTDPATGETFDGAAGDGGQLKTVLTLTGPAGLSVSTIHGTYGAAKTPLTFTATTGGVTTSLPAASVAAGSSTVTPFTLTLDKGVAAGTLNTSAVLGEAGTANTYSPQTGTTTVNTEPGAPAITGITYAARQSATVAFTAPSSTGGVAITGYRLSVTPTGAAAGTVPTYFYSTNTTVPLAVTATGLTGGASYTVTVAASNDSTPTNYGTESPAMTATPYDYPGAPGTPTVATSSTPKAAQISWTAGATNGSAISDYMITATDTTSGTAPTTVDTKSTGLTYNYTGLTNGDSYTFTVTAVNAAGSGPGSTSPASAPFMVKATSTPPTITSVSAASMQATVTFSAPTDAGGSAITDYQVIATTVPTSGAGTSTTQDAGATAGPFTFTGLTNGTTYTFTVTATNGAGTSAASGASSPVTPATVPGAPTGVTATAASQQATVTWTAPTDNGGAPITGYTVVATGNTGDPITEVTGSTSTSYSFTGLTNGVAYTFQVTATNASTTAGTSTATGPGSPSAASTPAVTPATVPGQPTAVTATAGDTTAAVTWTAPTSTGGSAITDYSVAATPSKGTPIVEDTMSTTTSYSFTGLTNGTSYTFTVTATNAPGSSTATGPGLPSAASAAVTPAGKPTAPTGVTATPLDGKATVSWTAPTSTGGSPITDYSVTATSSAGTTTKDTGSTSTSYSFTGLTDGLSYSFTVTASNAPGTSTGTGSSPASAASPAVTPIPAPPAPTAVTATRADMSAVVTWTAGTPAVATTDYLVTATSAAGAVTKDTMSGTSLSYTFAGLTNGTAYTFTVVAVNGSGNSPASTPSAPVTPAGKPTAPTNVTANGGNANATVTWTAASPNGDAITSYTVTAAPGGATATVMAPSGSTTVPTTAIVPGLTNGVSYTFTVTATNSVATGPASAASNAVTPNTVPSAPTNVVAKATGTSATVTWTAPTTTGGSPITSYTVTASSGQTVTVAEPAGGTTATFTGLTYGITYTFTVTATNGAGRGQTSVPSNAVVPAGVPAAPAAPTVTAANATITVTFAAPAGNGSAITSYTAVATPVAGGTPVSQTGPGSPITITGLLNGVSYVVRVSATNAVGNGPASPASAAVTPVAPVVAPSGPASISLSESRTFTTFGQQATLSGVVTQGGVVQANVPVTLTVTYTDGKVVRLAVTTTGANGAYSVKYTPIYNGTIVATALGGKSKGVLAKVIVIFTKVTASAKGGLLTVKASTAPGFLTGGNRKERVQILLVDSHGRQLKVLGIVNAAQRHGAAGQAHGVNDISFTTKALAAGNYHIAVKVIGTPVNTGAASKTIAIHVA